MENHKKVVECADGCGRTFEQFHRQHKFAPECVKRRAKEQYRKWFEAHYTPKFKTGKCHICGIETNRILHCKECAEQRNRDYAREYRRALAKQNYVAKRVQKEYLGDEDSETKKCGQVGNNVDCLNREEKCAIAPELGGYGCPTSVQIKKTLNKISRTKDIGWTPRGNIDTTVYKTGYHYKTSGRDSII